MTRRHAASRTIGAKTTALKMPTMTHMAFFEDVEFDDGLVLGRTHCVECGRDFLELRVPHLPGRATLCCSVRCQWARAERQRRWNATQGSADRTESGS
jgi:hypothetical protein